jgi:hypothetical protein
MEEFQKYFSRLLFTIIFRPKMIKFHPYSILTGEGKVDFLIYCMLRRILICIQLHFHENFLHFPYFRNMNVSRIDQKNVGSQKMDASSKSIGPHCVVLDLECASLSMRNTLIFRNNLPVVWI